MRYAPALRSLAVRPGRGVLLHGRLGAMNTALVREATAAAQRPLLALSAAEVYFPFLEKAERGLRLLGRDGPCGRIRFRVRRAPADVAPRRQQAPPAHG